MTTNTVPAKKGKGFKIILAVLGAVVVIPVAALAIFMATFDADSYRGDIAQLLSDKLGRKVALNGTMKLGFTGGLSLEINNASVDNPHWASRPQMAKIGQLSLALKLGPLLNKELDVKRIIVSDADIELETKGGQKNWDFGKSGQSVSPRSGPAEQAAQAPDGGNAVAAGQSDMPIALSISELSIKNSRFAMRDSAKGSVNEALIKTMSLQAEGKTTLKVEGEANGKAFTLALDGARWQDFLTADSWPFTAAATFMGHDIYGKGAATGKGSRVELSEFKLKTGFGSTVDGALNIAFLGQPRVDGRIHIDAVKLPIAQEGQAQTESPSVTANQNQEGQSAPAGGPARLFSDAKIDFSALRSANVNLQAVIDAVEADAMKLSQVQANIRLSGGRLELRPLSMIHEGRPINGYVTLQATQPARLELALAGQQIDVNPLLKTLGSLGMSLGKTDFALDLKSSGDSPRGFAENLNGTIKVEMGNGTLPLTTLKFMANNVIQAFVPGLNKADDFKMTCGSARFTAQNGVLTSNGLLIESNLTTIAGAGTISLREENLNMVFKPRPRDASLEQLAPSMRIAGSLVKPEARLDTVNTAANIAGSFLGANLPVGSDGLRVPLVNAEAAGNPCSAALDNPTYAETSAPPKTEVGKAVQKGRDFVQEKAKGLGERLGKALGGDKSPLKGLLGQ